MTGLAAVLLTLSGPAAAPEPITGIAVMCDPVHYRFSIRADATARDLDRSYPIAKLVPIDTLFFAKGLPGWTNEIDVQAPLIRYEQCGPYTFKLQGDAYNLYVQGESGAYDAFASLLIMRGPGIAYPADGSPLRLTACDRSLLRASPCPAGFATRLDGHYDAAAKKLRLTRTTISFDGDADAAEQRQVRQEAVDDDLALWRAD